MENIKSLFHSRKFVISLVYLAVTLLAAFVPQLADKIEIIAFGGAVVALGTSGLIAIEDTGKAWAENRPSSQQGAIAAIVDELKRVFLGIETPAVGIANAKAANQIDLTLGEDGVWTLITTAGTAVTKERLTDAQLAARVEALTRRAAPSTASASVASASDVVPNG